MDCSSSGLQYFSSWLSVTAYRSGGKEGCPVACESSLVESERGAAGSTNRAALPGERRDRVQDQTGTGRVFSSPPGGLASAFGCLEALYLLHPRRTPLYTTVRGAYMHGDAPMALITYAMLIVCLAPDR